MDTINILLVDDEKAIRETLKIILEDVGYKIYTAQSGCEALEIMRNNIVDLLITDLKMPKMNGIELMERALAIDPSIETIFISAFADIKSAIKAVKLGAIDYLEKSFTNKELILTIEKAVKRINLKSQNSNLKSKLLSDEFGTMGVIGTGEKMQKLFYIVNRIAPSKANVLITGESGVGKDEFAKLIHKKSLQKDNNFIALNCGAIPANLIETELFGHEKGSFTGAYQQKKGKFELANGGTLFLDEIGDLPLDMQVKFLRVLQEKQFFRIGSENSIKVDVRIIAATNKNLMTEIENGNFREDLYYRLNVVNIHIPPLREKKEDIPLLAEKFLLELSGTYDKSVKYLDFETLELLMNYNWRGNIRELRNVIERSILVCDDKEEILLKTHLPMEISGIDSSSNEEDKEHKEDKEDMTLSQYEKIIIRNTLKKYEGNKTKTAEALGIRRQTLYNKIKEYNLI
ncbi:MAG: sigma-54 dependent transcriptional regulator [Tissierellaceae bacterium]|nr:sigma-54 dependent transcriptional regulator [Tissierellaceae bacterium]